MNLTPEQLLDLVDALYLAALDDAAWSEFLARFAAAVGQARVMLHGHDLVLNRNLGFVDARYEPDYLSSFKEHYASINPWANRVAMMPVGRVQTSEVLVPRANLLRTEWYNDWIRPQEDIGTGAGVTLFRDNRRMFRISCNLRLVDQDRLQPRLVRLLDLLTPHMRRALDIARLRNAGSAHTIEALLDTFRHPAFLLDADGYCCGANRMGQDMLDAGRPVRLGRQGKLVRAQGAGIAGLEEQLHALSSGQPHAGGGLRLSSELTGSLVPLPRRETHRLSFPSNVMLTDPVAILLLRAPAERPANRADFSGLNLSWAETRLAEALFHGKSLSAAAMDRGISINTARNQLKALFEKTGTVRQAELVAFLHRIAADDDQDGTSGAPQPR